jgi:homocysteine S-methyltransferase
MQSPLDVILAAQPALILDGALATELERRGADLKDPLWSAKVLVERPALIHAVHRDYFAAGADVATTATYQATFAGFARRGLDHAAAAALMREAVALATTARDDFWADFDNRRGRRRPLVAASIGPYGAMLADGSEYRGCYGVSDDSLREFHGLRLDVLARSGADLLACETIPCLREALILAEVLRGYPDVTAWISFSCRDGAHDCEGEDVAACAAALERFDQVVAIGVNCTPPEFIGELVRRMANATDKVLVAYPNSGELYDPAAKRWEGDSHAMPFAAGVRAWFAAGARLIGGCCRTTPADIAAVRAALMP